ncbi:MAG TPA: lysine--tRNA ligase, partial [Nitrososphaera sp.]|nr:lysine--tRNA ligase [Nitrososphaera sp.]
LDKLGKKISKSAGNVLTPQMWMRYGSPESILLLLYKRISGTRSVGVEDVQSLMDEYDDYEDLYFGRKKEDNAAKLARIKGIYEYVNKLAPPARAAPHVPYNFLVQQAVLFPADSDARHDKIVARLIKYGMVKEKSDVLIERIGLAANWADDNSDDADTRYSVELGDVQQAAVQSLIQELGKFRGVENNADNAKELQSRVFEIARANGIEPRDFFALLYRMLFNIERGPRIGNYFLDLGIDRVIAILQKYL